MTDTWRNWGGTEAAVPRAVERPGSVAEVVHLVQRARAEGRLLRPIGSSHSFSGIGVPADIQVQLGSLSGLVAVDGARVTLRAGTPLHEIPGLLAPYGLAMANLGDIDRQTISGATSTGTHGTGAHFGGISTQIVGATVVDGAGEVRTLTETDSELAGVALGLGALGIVVDLTLQCVPEFSLQAVESTITVDDAIASFLDRVAIEDHYEFYWFPHTDRALTKTNTRLAADAARSGPGSVRRYVDDELLSNRMFGALCAIGSRIPALVPTIATLSGNALSERTFTDISTKVFASQRRVRFREMEYALALEDVPAALTQLRKMIDANGHRVSFPIEVRAAAADDLMLSTASGRASGYIAVHRYHRDDPESSAAYFADVEEIMISFGGRPHWGKMHTRDAEYLRSVYPRFDEFLALRERFDPYRLFANDYLLRVLG